MEKDDIVRADILKSAERVFQKWGFNKTTMEDIAREAGKGKSTLYYYFKSKEEILDAVIDVEFQKIIQKAKDSSLKAKSAKDRMIKYIVESINEMKDKISTYTIIWDEIKRDKNFVSKLREKCQQKEEQYVREILEAGIENKELNFIDRSEIPDAARAIVGMIHALELYLLLENDDRKQIDIAARFITYGL